MIGIDHGRRLEARTSRIERVSLPTPCPAGREILPPDLDGTSYVRPLDFDALGGCEFELLIVLVEHDEQPAILLVQREHHARYEACHEVGEEHEQPREEGSRVET